MADSTGNITLTLWEQNIGILTQNKSYQLNRFQIHQYRGKNELTFPLFGAEIIDLVDVSLPFVENNVTNLHSVSIIGVNKLDTTFTCINCKTLHCDLSDIITHCEHCGTKQKLRNHKISARLFLEDASAQSYQLRAHNEILFNIAPDSSTITAEVLLEAPPFDVAYDEFNGIIKVSRQ